MPFVSSNDLETLKNILTEQSNKIADVQSKLLEVENELRELKQQHATLVDRECMDAAFKQQERWLYDEMERHELLSANRDAKNLLYVKDMALNGVGQDACYSNHKKIESSVFARAEEARGDLRLYQLANAKLMSVLDEILTSLNIDYWFSCGTLIATHYRHAAIPWDDDIDIYLMREDADKLIDYLDNVGEGNLGYGYQVSVAYDRLAVCKQVRFSKIGALPCFIDLSLMDWSCAYSDEKDRRLHELRNEMNEEIKESSHLGYWDEHPFLYLDNTKTCVQVIDDNQACVNQDVALDTIEEIEHVFNKYRQRALDCGCLVERENAGGVIQGLEQVYDYPNRRFIWNKDVIFPTSREEYEGYMFKVPADPGYVCEECYPGSPYLPNDIVGHDHFSKNLLHNTAVNQAMCDFLEG